MARRLKKGQHLLVKNTIIYRKRMQVEPSKSKFISGKLKEFTSIGLSELEVPEEIRPAEIIPYIKQKPNTRSFFFLPIHLWVYNRVDSAKMVKKKERRNKRIEARFERKIENGKGKLTTQQIDTLRAKCVRKQNRRIWGERIMDNGEPPVLWDSSLMNKSTTQIKLFLNTKGYYEPVVTDSVSLSKNRAWVYYIIHPGIPYKIRSISYQIEDPAIKYEELEDTAGCLLKPGANYNVDLMNAERDRITRHFNNEGYYAFTKDYVYFTLDTDAVQKLMDITIHITKFLRQVSPDSTTVGQYKVYFINNVTIEMNYNPVLQGYNPKDTIKYNDYTFIFPDDKMGFKPKVIAGKIAIKKHNVYRITEKELTYAGLTQLKEFRYINIKFLPVEPDTNLLDCYIQLLPVVKLAFSEEAEGTNTGGNLGVQGDVLYENKNQFFGAEDMTFKIKGGLEEQAVLPNQSVYTYKYGPFNTLDIGPELDISVPRPIFPFNLFKFSRGSNPQTSFKLSYDDQEQPYYKRNLLGGSYNIDWNETPEKHWTVTPIEVERIDAVISPAFNDILSNYPFLKQSFQNQFITDSRVIFKYSNQTTVPKLHNYWFVKITPESSGNILREFFGYQGAFGNRNWDQSEKGSFNVFNIPFSEYLRIEGDCRYYWILNKYEKVVGRVFMGTGYPYGNLDVLPFDKSFWAGGADDIRGWLARSLGPGGSQAENIIDNIGDVKLEANAEYRVSVIKYFGLALFADYGNIWLLPTKTNSAIPEGEFRFTGADPAWDQLALDAGIGFRFDFNYFVVRWDPAIPLNDPSQEPRERWRMNDILLRRVILSNIGIGYPF